MTPDAEMNLLAAAEAGERNRKACGSADATRGIVPVACGHVDRAAAYHRPLLRAAEKTAQEALSGAAAVKEAAKEAAARAGFKDLLIVPPGPCPCNVYDCDPWRSEGGVPGGKACLGRGVWW